MSRWYGSIQNRIEECAKFQKPEVGMGVTETWWSDRSPWEIIEVIDDRHIVVRELSWKRTDSNGFSEWQEYEYTSNPNGRVARLFLTKQGRWRERIGRNGLGDNGWIIGRAERYRDPSF